MAAFVEPEVTVQDAWRSIILFGRNVATYKFALAKSLLELAERGQESVTLEQLAVPFSRHIRDHVASSDKQITSSSSRFLDACRAANRGELTDEELRTKTVQLGFNNVIDAFHVVGGGDVPTRFFVDERTHATKGIRLTDELLALRHDRAAESLEHEVEARWRLVETAWTLRMPRVALTVEHELDSGLLVPRRDMWERRDITQARDALHGYQRGICFYCGRSMRLTGSEGLLSDVDHFFPHVLKPTGVGRPIDGVWNLVLACQDCNRGQDGKFDRLPTLRFLEALHARNTHLIKSHHPLGNTIQMQTGKTERERRTFLQRTYDAAASLLNHRWEPTEARQTHA